MAHGDGSRYHTRDCSASDRRMRHAVAAIVLLALGAFVHASGYDLARDEQLGGHTLARHVGRTDAQLHQRLDREPQISAASTYDARSTAERVVGETISRFSARVSDWKARKGNRPNLTLRFKGDSRAIGRSLERGQREPVACYDALVVLRWDERRHDAYVLTSYPEARR
jgi:hypothetical protein